MDTFVERDVEGLIWRERSGFLGMHGFRICKFICLCNVVLVCMMELRCGGGDREDGVEWFSDQFQLGDVETDRKEVGKGESQRGGGSE
jgi:hypothetical protein